MEHNDEESLENKMYEMDLMETRSGVDGKEVKIRPDANILKLAIMENAKIKIYVATIWFCDFRNFAHLEIYLGHGTKYQGILPNTVVLLVIF